MIILHGAEYVGAQRHRRARAFSSADWKLARLFPKPRWRASSIFSPMAACSTSTDRLFRSGMRTSIMFLLMPALLVSACARIKSARRAPAINRHLGSRESGHCEFKVNCCCSTRAPSATPRSPHFSRRTPTTAPTPRTLPISTRSGTISSRGYSATRFPRTRRRLSRSPASTISNRLRRPSASRSARERAFA